jgi:3,4-dihydroxy 2-butanone 4-phosphate synthase/GTP cyclohydrolase II
MMVQTNSSKYGTPFTVSVEAKEGTTTGISAQDRSLTSMRLADSKYQATDFVTPGHTFPLRAREGGVLVRAGHTEAAVDLARMSGKAPAGVICEIMNEDGTMARMEQLKVVAQDLGVKLVSIEDLISYRSKREKLVERKNLPNIQTPWGEFRVIEYQDSISGEEHLAIISDGFDPLATPLVRVHVACTLGDVFQVGNSPCHNRLHKAMEKIGKEGGVLLYLRHKENLISQIIGSKISPEGVNARWEDRSYGVGMQILSDLGIHKMKILSSNAQKITGLKGRGLEIIASEAF